MLGTLAGWGLVPPGHVKQQTGEAAPVFEHVKQQTGEAAPASPLYRLRAHRPYWLATMQEIVVVSALVLLINTDGCCLDWDPAKPPIRSCSRTCPRHGPRPPTFPKPSRQGHGRQHRHVQMRPDAVPYLGFEWQGQFYRFSVLPLGLATTPRIYRQSWVTPSVSCAMWGFGSSPIWTI